MSATTCLVLKFRQTVGIHTLPNRASYTECPLFRSHVRGCTWRRLPLHLLSVVWRHIRESSLTTVPTPSPSRFTTPWNSVELILQVSHENQHHFTNIALVLLSDPTDACSSLFRDLTRRCFPAAPANAIRCYELMCVHVGLVPVQFATKHIRSLASALFETSLGAHYPISLIQWRQFT